jgi:hypothetical protein
VHDSLSVLLACDGTQQNIVVRLPLFCPPYLNLGFQVCNRSELTTCCPAIKPTIDSTLNLTRFTQFTKDTPLSTNPLYPAFLAYSPGTYCSFPAPWPLTVTITPLCHHDAGPSTGIPYFLMGCDDTILDQVSDVFP